MTDKQNLPWQLEELRDKFAMAAMQSDWTAQGEDCGYYTSDSSDEQLLDGAELYYRMADAMLKARG